MGSEEEKVGVMGRRKMMKEGMLQGSKTEEGDEGKEGGGKCNERRERENNVVVKRRKTEGECVAWWRGDEARQVCMCLVLFG